MRVHKIFICVFSGCSSLPSCSEGDGGKEAKSDQFIVENGFASHQRWWGDGATLRLVRATERNSNSLRRSLR